MKLGGLIDRRYAAALLVILGIILAISPAGLRRANGVTAQQLAEIIVNESDHITAEEVAQRLIDKEPDLQIADLRSAEEYATYHIPEAVNIPLTRLFNADEIDKLDTGKTIVLCSNGGTHAAQAWVLLKQMGIESYVLLGGLNYWTEAILNPQAPSGLVANSEILKYQFRKGASEHFAGGVTPTQSDSTIAPPKPKTTIDPKMKKKARAGC